MLHPLEVSDLKHRLDRMSDQLTQARSGLAATYPDFESDLAAFVDRHDSIRSMMDESAAKTVLSTAERATTELEQGFENWLKSIDKRYAHPRMRRPNVSM